jgi:hypothetical protein
MQSKPNSLGQIFNGSRFYLLLLTLFAAKFIRLVHHIEWQNMELFVVRFAQTPVLVQAHNLKLKNIIEVPIHTNIFRSTDRCASVVHVVQVTVAVGTKVQAGGHPGEWSSRFEAKSAL